MLILLILNTLLGTFYYFIDIFYLYWNIFNIILKLFINWYCNTDLLNNNENIVNNNENINNIKEAINNNKEEILNNKEEILNNKEEILNNKKEIKNKLWTDLDFKDADPLSEAELQDLFNFENDIEDIKKELK